jgi:hypothetical protein
MKTLVAIDFLKNKPNLYLRIIFYLRGIKIHFSKRNDSWCYKRLVKGKIDLDGYFYPFNKKMYKIYWSYGILK